MKETSGVLGAGLAIGFCLAGSEARQYTAVFDYGTKGLPVLAASIIFLLVGYLGLALVLRRSTPSRLLGAFGFLSLLQSLSLVAQCAHLGTADSWLVAVLLPAFGESYSIGFVLLAALAATFLGEKSLRAFILSFGVAGLLQFAMALLRPSAAIVALCLFPAVSFALAAAFCRQAAKAPGRFPEKPEAGVFPFHHGQLSILLLVVFLMGALLVATHAIRMGYQDGGTYSFVIQALSGLGGVGAAFLLSALHRKIVGTTKIALVFLTVLTILLAALYLTSLFENIVVLALLIVLHRAAYGFVYYFAWTLGLEIQRAKTSPLGFVLVFSLLKLGWAAGVLLFMTLPASFPSPIFSAMPLAFLAIMGIADFGLFVRMAPSTGKAAAEPAAEEARIPAMPFDEACREVAQRYRLTKRETEVLFYLGKGRSSAYIQEKMVISGGTVRTHTDHIYKKLGVHSQQEVMDSIEAQETSTKPDEGPLER